MTAVNRSSALKGIMCVAIAASMGFVVMPKVVRATPLASSLASAVKPDGLVEKARVTIHVHPRRHYRHRRHHHCWWRGGRRVCGWR
jgi:hypothetical protein